MANLKILHVITGLNVGGAEMMLRRLVDRKDDNLHENFVVSLTDIGRVGILMIESGVSVTALNIKGLLDAPRALYMLIKMIIKIRPDIVQTWMYHADLLGGVAARLTGIKNIIWGIRTTELSAGSSRSAFVMRYICSKLSSVIPELIVCAAESSRKYHIGLGYDASRMRVISNGFIVNNDIVNDERFISETKKELGIDDDGIIIGFVGRFHFDKDQENFVTAANILCEKRNDISFLMAGRDLDNSNKELVSWIAKNHFSHKFFLLGERADVPRLLSCIDIFCLSSRIEGFPNVVGEAMAAGIPCVVTDVGDAAFLVGSTGIVVPKESPVALAEGLSHMLEMSPMQRKILGAKARKRIITEFSINNSKKKFEDLYNTLLKSQTGNF